MRQNILGHAKGEMAQNVLISFLLLQGVQNCLGYKNQFLDTSKPMVFA